jgi:hypothetical protein
MNRTIKASELEQSDIGAEVEFTQIAEDGHGVVVSQGAL